MIFTFESLFGSGTMEWIPLWTRDAKSGIWFPFILYAVLLLGLSLVLARVTPDKKKIVHEISLWDFWLGSRVGGFFNILLACVFTLYSARTLRLGTHLVHYIALPYTPTLVLVLLALLIPVQLFLGGFESLLRYQVFLFWPAILVAGFLLLMPLVHADFGNLLPLWPSSWGAIMDSCKRVMDLLTGLLLLFVYFPLIHRYSQEKISSRSVLIAGLGVIFFNSLNVLVALSVLGPFETSSLQWPILEAIRIQKLPSLFLERLDLVFFLPVLIAVSSAVNLYAFGAYHVLSQYNGGVRSKLGMGLYFFTIILLATLPDTLDHILLWYNWAFYVVEGLSLFLLPVLWWKNVLFLQKTENVS